MAAYGGRMRAFLVGAALLGTALAAIGSCALDQDGTGEDFVGPGTSSGSGGGEGAGNPGTACTDRAECPADGQCAVYACTGGFCTPTFLPAGSEVAGSIAGDCKRVICSASGTPTEQADTADVPAGDDCNKGSCDGTTPVLTPESNKSTCGLNGALHCLNGVCVGCTVATDCGLELACEDRVCNASNRCGTTPKPAGTEASDTSQTDCTQDVCDGVMATHSPEVDGFDCNGGAMDCYQGVCSECGVPGDCPLAPECKTATCDGTCGLVDGPNGTDCGSGDHCFGGECSECSMPTHCPAPTECITGYACPAGECVPTNAPTGTSCAGGKCLTGMCVECLVPADCPPPSSPCHTVTCDGNVCGETPIADGGSCGTDRECCSLVCCGPGKDCTAIGLCSL